MYKRLNILSCSFIEEISHLLPKEKRVFLIIDAKVRELYGHNFPYEYIEISATEKNKSFETILFITRKLMELGADRDSLLLIIGGGITTDIGAFTASIYFRGVDFILVPTTLLSQVDAAIGGKNGINVDGYKNILGVIRQPLFTVICPEFLATLTQTELKEGASELLKTFILKDREGFCKAAAVLKRGEGLDNLAPYISKAASIKANIVEHDIYEKGDRKLLNLGHTFAHALEKECGISHGEAVSIGIVLAARLSVKLKILRKEEADTIEEDFIRAGLKTKLPIDSRQLISTIKRDKKRSGDSISFILIKRIGKCIIYPIQIACLEEALYDLS